MERNTKILIGVFIIIFIIVAGVYLFGGNLKTYESFTTNTIIFKLNIPFSGETVNPIRITNEENQEQSFKITFKNLDSIVSAEQDEFSISAKESKDINITFRDFARQIEVYTGELIIESPKAKKTIPVILTIQDQYNDFGIVQNPIPKYNIVTPGGKLGMDIKIVNLKDNQLHNIKAVYEVRNMKNEIIISENEDFAVGDSVIKSKIFDIPKTLDYGNYVFITSIEYDTSKAIATNVFEIERNKSNEILNYTVVLILIFVMSFFAMFFYSMKTRDELISKLKTQQKRELIGNIKIVNRYEKELKDEKQKILNKKREESKKLKQKLTDEIEKEKELKKLRYYKTRKESEKLKQAEKRKQELAKYEGDKKRILKEFNERIKQVKEHRKNLVCKIKQKQEKQIKEVASLKKKGKKKEIKERLRDWEKEAQKMNELKKEVKEIPKEKIQEELNNRQKEVQKEYMNKFYSNLGKKDIKMK